MKISKNMILTGNCFKNAIGVVVEILEPAADGRYHFQFSLSDDILLASVDSLCKSLNDNGYELVSYKGFDLKWVDWFSCETGELVHHYCEYSKDGGCCLGFSSTVEGTMCLIDTFEEVA